MATIMVMHTILGPTLQYSLLPYFIYGYYHGYAYYSGSNPAIFPLTILYLWLLSWLCILFWVQPCNIPSYHTLFMATIMVMHTILGPTLQYSLLPYFIYGYYHGYV